MRNNFLGVLKFLQIKEGGLNFWGEPILQNVSIIWSLLLYFNLKSSMHTNSSSFTAFQFILHDSGVLFSAFSNLDKWKRGDLISGWNQICRMSDLFGLFFCISVFKSFYTRILHHSLDFTTFCINQADFFQSPEFSTN